MPWILLDKLAIYGRSNLWISAIRRSELFAKGMLALHANYRVCEKHFSEHMIMRRGKFVRLKTEALPVFEGK